MPGLVSLLDKTHYALVEEIWRDLEIGCGLTGIHVTPLPHISWQIAEGYDWDALENILLEIAADTKPFKVHTSGMALFTGENPVVYIPVVRTKRLSEFHENIWQRLDAISTGASLYYSPPFWMPHISLDYNDLDPEKLTCLMNKLAFRTIYWAIEIDNLTLIYESEGAVGPMRYRYEFGKKESGNSSSQ